MGAYESRLTRTARIARLGTVRHCTQADDNDVRRSSLCAVLATSSPWVKLCWSQTHSLIVSTPAGFGPTRRTTCLPGSQDPIISLNSASFCYVKIWISNFRQSTAPSLSSTSWALFSAIPATLLLSTTQTVEVRCERWRRTFASPEEAPAAPPCT